MSKQFIPGAVAAAIESELEYQLARWKGAARGHEIAAWLTYMRSYLDEAANIASHNSERGALDSIRKVVALGIACMAEHGAPERPRIAIELLTKP